jgi:hypothetical protein
MYAKGSMEEGKPIQLHEMNIEELAKWLHDQKIRTTQGKIIQPLHKGHLEVLNDPARFKVLACGRRWGKTLLTSLVALSVLFQINRRVWIVAPDYSLCDKVFRELYNILVRQLKLINPGKKDGGRARNQKGDYYLETPWGSVLEAKSMENPDSLAGEALDLVIIDEAALSPRLEEIWNQMLQPTLMDKSGSSIFISTPRGKNGFYKLFLYGELGKKQRQGLAPVAEDADGISNDMRDWSSFQRTSYDNPLLGATPEDSKKEVDAAYRRAVLAGKQNSFAQEYLADFESVEDIVFPGFFAADATKAPYKHVVDYHWHPDEGLVYAACDHNFAKPASTIFAQVNRYGDVIIFDERFTKHTTTYMQAQQIHDKEKELTGLASEIWKKEGRAAAYRRPIKFAEVVADISGNQVRLDGRASWDDFEDVLGRRPVGLKQDRQTGCDLIRLWLNFPQFDSRGAPVIDENNKQKSHPKLFITSNCVNTITAVSTASFKEVKSIGSFKEDYKETPEGYEGLLDAIRYLLVYLFHDRGDKIEIIGGF